MSPTIALRAARFAELDAATLYALLRLRIDVFVVEQRCPYPDLDGRDTEAGTRHLWLEQDGAPLAYLRLLEEPDGRARVGRVVVARTARGTGLSRRLIRAALERIGERECALGAQSHLVGLYASLGFVSTGPEYLEDGIPHTPMRRPSSPPDAIGEVGAAVRYADDCEATSAPADRHPRRL